MVQELLKEICREEETVMVEGSALVSVELIDYGLQFYISIA